jgi:hypothetical protein
LVHGIPNEQKHPLLAEELPIKQPVPRERIRGEVLPIERTLPVRCEFGLQKRGQERLDALPAVGSPLEIHYVRSHGRCQNSLPRRAGECAKRHRLSQIAEGAVSRNAVFIGF